MSLLIANVKKILKILKYMKISVNPTIILIIYCRINFLFGKITN